MSAIDDTNLASEIFRSLQLMAVREAEEWLTRTSCFCSLFELRASPATDHELV